MYLQPSLAILPNMPGQLTLYWTPYPLSLSLLLLPTTHSQLMTRKQEPSEEDFVNLSLPGLCVCECMHAYAQYMHAHTLCSVLVTTYELPWLQSISQDSSLCTRSRPDPPIFHLHHISFPTGSFPSEVTPAVICLFFTTKPFPWHLPGLPSPSSYCTPLCFLG